MIHPWSYRRLLGVALALGGILATGAARADLTLNPVVTPLGNGLFHYDYTINNDTQNTLPNDPLAVIDITVPTGIGTILNLGTPSGFQSAYDSGLGIVSFLSDSSSFDPGFVQNGFVFDSRFGPGNSAFDALSFNGVMLNGVTLAPVVPEPGALAVGAASLLVGTALLRRRRQRLTL